MKRVLADIFLFALLFGLLKVFSFVTLVSFRWDMYVLLAAPFVAGFVRGVLENQFLKQIPRWIAAVECGLVVLTSDMIFCALGSTGKAPDNFWTIFGAFFVIFIVPSVPLSIGGFFVGRETTSNRSAR